VSKSLKKSFPNPPPPISAYNYSYPPIPPTPSNFQSPPPPPSHNNSVHHENTQHQSKNETPFWQYRADKESAPPTQVFNQVDKIQSSLSTKKENDKESKFNDFLQDIGSL
jgi:hypothetical protein